MCSRFKIGHTTIQGLGYDVYIEAHDKESFLIFLGVNGYTLPLIEVPEGFRNYVVDNRGVRNENRWGSKGPTS